MPPLTLSQYDHLWAVSEIPMCVVDLDGRFARCNKSYCKLVGYSESELRLRKWQDITCPSDLDGDIASVAALRADDDSDGYSLIKSYITKANKIVLIQLYVLAIRDDADHAVAYYVTALPLASDNASKPAEKFSLIQWATRHPKDALIISLGGGLLLGRDTIVELLKLWLSK